jgi:3-isopropylmalate/(R)-2-methylmalate dehydratase large subunit
MNNFRPCVPDRDAEYDELYQVSIDQLTPLVGCPGNGKGVKPAAEIEGLTIRQVVIGTASNGRFDDLRIAADVLKGKHVHEDVVVYVYPGSRAVYLEALKKGLIRVFIEAGAMVMNPGGEPFASVKDGGLADGDRCLATTTCYDTEGRCSGKPELYLCSPATAAASALNGAVTDPSRYVR